MRPTSAKRSFAAHGLAAVLGLTGLALFVLPGWSEPPAELPPPRKVAEPSPHQGLSASDAIHYALEHNPALATFRKQRGIAEAAVVVSRQYPFNPILQHFIWYGNGPASAGVTNHVFQEHTSRIDVEWNHQGRYRQGTAREALTRTQWEIAAQELLISIQTARAFNNVLYRRGKYRLLEETAKFTEQTAQYIARMAEQAVLTGDAVLLARLDVTESQAALGPGRSLLTVAENDLRRALGLVDEPIEVEDTLEKGFETPEKEILVKAALERRPDLRAFQYAVREADNRLRFEIANRWGNPSIGPAGEVNETSVGFIGMWLIWSPPIINTRKGEIRQREAEKARAMQAVTQSQIQVQQDVHAALNRLKQAEGVVQTFRTKTLPALREARETLDKMFEHGQKNIDLARLIDIRRRLLRSRDTYLDALLELSQAQADLAAAVGDLSFVGCLKSGETANTNESSSAAAAQPTANDQASPQRSQ